MNSIEIKLDEFGRILIPKKIRDHLNIRSNDKLLLDLNDDEIVIKKKNQTDIFDSLVCKLDYLNDKFDIDYLVIDKGVIVETSFEYENFKLSCIDIFPKSFNGIVNCNNSKLTKDLNIVKPHYYFFTNIWNSSLLVYVIINDISFQDDVLSHLNILI